MFDYFFPVKYIRNFSMIELIVVTTS